MSRRAQLTHDGAFGSGYSATALTSPTSPGVKVHPTAPCETVPSVWRDRAGERDLELDVGALRRHARQVDLAREDHAVARATQLEPHGRRRRRADLGEQPRHVVEAQVLERQVRADVAVLLVARDGDVAGRDPRAPAAAVRCRPGRRRASRRRSSPTPCPAGTPRGLPARARTRSRPEPRARASRRAGPGNDGATEGRRPGARASSCQVTPTVPGCGASAQGAGSGVMGSGRPSTANGRGSLENRWWRSTSRNPQRR